jgi:hypothetical protein
MLCVKPIILPRKMQIMDEMLSVQRATRYKKHNRNNLAVNKPS